MRGEIERKTAVQAAQQAHRNYAKRQMTWFRREPDVIWISGFGDDARVQSEAIERIAACGDQIKRSQTVVFLRGRLVRRPLRFSLRLVLRSPPPDRENPQTANGR